MKTKQKNPTRIYRTVSVEDRLPEESEIVMYRTNFGSTKVGFLSHNGFFISENYIHMLSDVSWWLEEIQLPSEEEIENMAEELAFPNSVKFGANFILNKLKGG